MLNPATLSEPEERNGQTSRRVFHRAGVVSLEGILWLGCLNESRGVQNRLNPPDLTTDQILAWADAHFESVGKWPNAHGGAITGTDETWGCVNAALERGVRRLPGGSSLAKLLSERRGKRNIRDLPPLSVQQILSWAYEHKRKTGRWPNGRDGDVEGTDEKWVNIDQALVKGLRHLPSGSSLAKLRDKYLRRER